jgi:hypothetical protein
MYKKGESKNLIELFVKKATKKDLPDLSKRTDISDLKKKYEKLAKYEEEIEELRAPLYQKRAEMIGLDAKEMMNIQKKEEQVLKQMKGVLGQPLDIQTALLGPRQFSPPNEYQVTDPHDPFGLCEEIKVRICKERVCVDQPLPLHVDEISQATDSGCAFQKHGDTKFEASDGVSGSYHYSHLCYHRDWKESIGAINILASGELVQPAKVRTIGITYKSFPDPAGVQNITNMNQTSACGWSRIAYPNSWGRARKNWDLKIMSRIPGGAAAIEFESAADIQVEDTGQCEWGGEHGCLYGGCWIKNTILGVENPPNGQVTIAIPVDKNFPAGTIFIIESSLGYWIKAGGDKASAYIQYGLEILPFISIEACSYEYPENVTIRVSDWL